jgi:hypothetical protein
VEAGVKSKRHKGAPDADEDAAAALSKSGGLANILDELLEGDFDPDAYDKRMAAAFDDDYYEVGVCRTRGGMGLVCTAWVGNSWVTLAVACLLVSVLGIGNW